MQYRPETIITIPAAGSMDAPYLGTLGPYTSGKASVQGQLRLLFGRAFAMRSSCLLLLPAMQRQREPGTNPVVVRWLVVVAKAEASHLEG